MASVLKMEWMTCTCLQHLGDSSSRMQSHMYMQSHAEQTGTSFALKTCSPSAAADKDALQPPAFVMQSHHDLFMTTCRQVCISGIRD